MARNKGLLLEPEDRSIGERYQRELLKYPGVSIVHVFKSKAELLEAFHTDQGGAKEVAAVCIAGHIMDWFNAQEAERAGAL